MSSIKNLYAKTAKVTKQMASKTRDAFTSTGSKIVDCLTPKRDYSYLPEKYADAMRKIDRAETIDNICWFSFYLIYYLILIAYCIKQAKDIEAFPMKNNTYIKAADNSGLYFL